MLTPEQQRARAKAQWTPEARAKASAAAKARHAAKRGASPSPSSNGSASFSPGVPRPLPAPTTAPTSASEPLLERLLSKLETLAPTMAEETRSSLPELPDDNDEREAALRPARWPARVPVTATDELLQVFGLRGLSDPETEQGLDAWAALFWQWGLYKDGRVLVALWLFGVAAPRVGDAVAARRARKKALEAGAAPELAAEISATVLAGGNRKPATVPSNGAAKREAPSLGASDFYAPRPAPPTTAAP